MNVNSEIAGFCDLIWKHKNRLTIIEKEIFLPFSSLFMGKNQSVGHLNILNFFSG